MCLGFLYVYYVRKAGTIRLVFKVTDKRVNGQIPTLPNAYECQLAQIALRSNTPKAS